MREAACSLGLADLVQQNARVYPGRVSVVCGPHRLDFRQIDLRSSRLAHAWQRRTIGPGDRLFWLGRNCHRLLECLFAAAKVGAVLCPVNWRLSPEEISYIVSDAAPRAVYYDRQLQESLAGLIGMPGGATAEWLPIDYGEAEEYEALLAGNPSVEVAWEPVDPATGVLQMYTAAFDGRPHGAVLSHQSLIVQSLATALAKRLDQDDRYLACGPLFHMATLISAFCTFHLGGLVVVAQDTDARTLCELIERQKCTRAFLVAPTMEKILAVNQDGRYDLTSLREPLGSAKWNRMIGYEPGSSKFIASGGYGQTELAGMVAFRSLDPNAVGSSGRTSPAVASRIVDADDRDVAVGEIGELVLRGPPIMIGYHGWSAAAARERFRGGWYHTTDLCRQEADGSLTFVGPKGRIIKSGGENVYPTEVEQCLDAHPDIIESAVIGVPDAVWGQRVKAVIVLRGLARLQAVDVIEHCRERLASYKKPSVVEFANQLPRREGRIDYAEIDRRYGGGNYPGA